MYNYNNPYQQPNNNYQQVQHQMDALKQEYYQKLEGLKQQVQQPQPFMPNANLIPENQQQMPNVVQPQSNTPPHVQQLSVLGDIKGSLDKLIEINTKLFDSLTNSPTTKEVPIKEENKIDEKKEVKTVKK